MELVAHDILKHGTANGHAERHAQRSHEGIHGSGPAGVFDSANGLDSNIDAGEDHAITNTEDSEYDCPDTSRGAFIKENQQAARHGRDSPTHPDGPSVPTNPSGNQRDNDASGEKEERNWENIQTSYRGRREFDRREIEREVIEGAEELSSKRQLLSFYIVELEGTYDKTLEQGTGICGNSRD